MKLFPATLSWFVEAIEYRNLVELCSPLQIALCHICWQCIYRLVCLVQYLHHCLMVWAFVLSWDPLCQLFLLFCLHFFFLVKLMPIPPPSIRGGHVNKTLYSVVRTKGEGSKYLLTNTLCCCHLVRDDHHKSYESTTPK